MKTHKREDLNKMLESFGNVVLAMTSQTDLFGNRDPYSLTHEEQTKLFEETNKRLEIVLTPRTIAESLMFMNFLRKSIPRLEEFVSTYGKINSILSAEFRGNLITEMERIAEVAENL